MALNANYLFIFIKLLMCNNWKIIGGRSLDHYLVLKITSQSEVLF